MTFKRTQRPLALGLVLTLAFAATALALINEDGAEGETSPRMSAQEHEQLRDLLHESETQYLALLAGVSDAQWSFKPAPDRWSVGECAEHILRSNEALYEAAKTAMSGERNPEWQEKTQGKAALLMQVMPNRRPGGAGGATAPQEIRPNGELSRVEIVKRFRDLHQEIENYIDEHKDRELKAYTTEHPFPIFNTLSAYDWLIYVPLHTVRHSRQMIEVMESDGYP